MDNHTKVYGGGLAKIDGMGMATTFGVGVKIEDGKTLGHFICSINPPGPEMVVNAPVESAEFSAEGGDGKVTLKGTDKIWGAYTAILEEGKMDLTWTKPFGPKGDTHITEMDTLAVVKFE